MKKLIIFCCLLSSVILLAAPQVRAARQSAVYKVGEDIVFNITDRLPFQTPYVWSIC